MHSVRHLTVVLTLLGTSLAGTPLLYGSVHAQTATAASATISLIGARGQRHTVTGTELAAMTHREVTASAHSVSGTFSGVALAELLRSVDAPRGDSLRGPALATYVLVEAADGYRALFALAEVDAGFSDKIILLADHKDGAALSAKDGPFQLIVPDEKRPARWVRQVRRIRVVQLPVASR